MAKSDYDVIYAAYMKYGDSVNGKKMKLKKAKAECGQIFSRVDRCLLVMDSTKSTVVEKNKRLAECKSLFQKYSVIKKSLPESITNSLSFKMDKLMKQVALHEESMVGMFRDSETGGERISLEAVMNEPSNIRRLMSCSITGILKEALRDDKYTIISKEDKAVYITQTGNKYHRVDCPYCRRTKLTKTSYAKIENAGYEPCRCIAELNEKEDNHSPKPTMTVFIDESVRDNVWKKFLPSLKNTQASYSYIICSGNLKSEDEITKENTISKNACLANEANDTNYAAIEAINLVLMKMAFAYNFDGDVVIYTDNLGAMKKWYKDMGNHFLAEHFNSVKVEHISRDKNKKADAIGRERIFTDVPRTIIKSFDKLREENKALKRENLSLENELRFVKKYFSNPWKQIPNLIRELRFMAYERE